MTVVGQETGGARSLNRPLSGTAVKSRCLIIHPRAGEENVKTIVVLGVERGGTSMVAGVLRALGIDMGSRVGLNHEDPRFITNDQDILKRVIDVRNRQAKVWGFKMPKAATMLDFFESNLRNPYYLIVYRNLASVADSWKQRGTGEYLGVIERGLELNRIIIDHLHKSSRPAVIVNYERAVASKRATVEDILGFLGLTADEAAIDRAVGIMAGDGEGYFNLPEHFFAVSPMPIRDERSPLATVSNFSEVVDADGWITFKTTEKRLILRLEDGSKLPQKFWLMLDLSAPSSLDLKKLPLRVYFDFIGQMFPAHCARPPIVQGRNQFLVETSGMASAIGFGPLVPNLRFRLAPELRQALPDDGLAKANQHNPAS